MLVHDPSVVGVTVAAETDHSRRLPREGAGPFRRDAINPTELGVVSVVPVAVEHKALVAPTASAISARTSSVRTGPPLGAAGGLLRQRLGPCRVAVCVASDENATDLVSCGDSGVHATSVVTDSR